MTVRDLNTGKPPRTAQGRAYEINARLATLNAEREQREARGVPLPFGLTEAIEVLERQLANPFNREEADNIDEAEGFTDGSGWLWLAVLSGCILGAALLYRWLS